jgi:hypothetical protein
MGAMADVNPFAQSVPASAPAAIPRLSRVIAISGEGYPIFEDPADTQAVMNSVPEQSKKILLGIPRGLRDPIDDGALLLTRTLEKAAPAGSSFQRFMTGERQRVEQINQNAEDDYQKNWQGGAASSPDIGRDIGKQSSTWGGFAGLDGKGFRLPLATLASQPTPGEP